MSVDKEFDNLSGREIINSFGKLNHEYLFFKIRDLAKRLEKKFHRCSSNPEVDWIFDGRLKELESKKFPYRIVKRLEWFEPTEDVKNDK